MTGRSEPTIGDHCTHRQRVRGPHRNRQHRHDEHGGSQASPPRHAGQAHATRQAAHRPLHGQPGQQSVRQAGHHEESAGLAQEPPARESIDQAEEPAGRRVLTNAEQKERYRDRNAGDGQPKVRRQSCLWATSTGCQQGGERRGSWEKPDQRHGQLVEPS